MRDDCEVIGTPSFYISSTGNFNVHLAGVTTPHTTYEVDLFLFWWPPTLPTITVQVYDDDTIGGGDDSLGTVVLERNMMRQYVVLYNTTGGKRDLGSWTS